MEQPNWFFGVLKSVFQNHSSNFDWAPAELASLSSQDFLCQNLEKKGYGRGLLLQENGEVASKELYTRHVFEAILDVARYCKVTLSEDLFCIVSVSVAWALKNQEARALEASDVWRKSNTQQSLELPLQDWLQQEISALEKEWSSTSSSKDSMAVWMNQGLSYFTVLQAGLLSMALLEDQRLVSSEISRIAAQVQKDRSLFVEATIALAWSNGLLENEERDLIKKQIEQNSFARDEQKRLLRLLLTPSTPKEFAKNVSTPLTAAFVLRQLVLASFVDGQQDQKELDFLTQTAIEMGHSNESFQQIQTEMTALLSQRK